MLMFKTNFIHCIYTLCTFLQTLLELSKKVSFNKKNFEITNFSDLVNIFTDFTNIINKRSNKVLSNYT